MNQFSALCITIFGFGSLAAIAQTTQPAPPPDSTFMLRGGTVHTISGPVIENGSVLVRDGKIVGVGKDLAAPEGIKIIDIQGQHVYPGMIDSASSIGQPKPADDAPPPPAPGMLSPDFRAVSGIDAGTEHIPAALLNGVTSVVEIPEGELISGEMSLIRLDPSAKDAIAGAPPVAIHLRFPAIVTIPVPPHETDEDDDDPAAASRIPPRPFEEAKKEYDAKMRALNTFFDEANRYRDAKLAQGSRPGPEPDPQFEPMLPVLDGTAPLFVTAVREREIREAIEFADKQKIKIVLADAYEAYKVLPLIKSHNIPVVLGPPLSLPLNPDDPYDRSFTTPGELYRAGIKFSIATFSGKGTRNLPYQAAAGVPFGLPPEEAYKAVSLNAAEIFGSAKRMGSIDEGKIADLIVTDGDPLEVTTHINMAFVGGKPITLNTRQKQIYEKYQTVH